jgi:predicted amidohydrolase
MRITIAGYQMPVGEDVPQNVAKLCAAVKRAAAAHADILLTPEGSLSGYTPFFDPALVADGLRQVTDYAREQRVGLALGTCYKESDDLTYNQVRFYTATGEFLGFHSKILRCGTLDDPPQGEINHYAATELRTFDFLGVRVGALICNDLWANPQCTPMPDSHLTQELAHLGARIVFHAVNGGRDGGEWSREVAWRYHEANLRMRAAAGKLWIVTADNSAPETLPCSAPSGVLSPQGTWVCRAQSQGEQFFTHTIELD